MKKTISIVIALLFGSILVFNRIKRKKRGKQNED